MEQPEPLIPKHCGYQSLKTFQLGQLIYDVTVRFCNRYVDRRSRTHDQMVQAARSRVQNIAEGSQAAGTSKKIGQFRAGDQEARDRRRASGQAAAGSALADAAGRCQLLNCSPVRLLCVA